MLAYGADDYEAVLSQLEREGLPPERVVVVHNPRLAGEADLAPARTGVRVVRMATNGGYAYAMNAGMVAARRRGAERFLLLTHDAAMEPGALVELVTASKAAPRPGICGPRLRWMEADGGVSCDYYGGWWTSRGDVGHHADGPIALQPPVPGLSRCDWVDGAVMLVEGAVLDVVGPLDERWFLYFEETDYCLRALRAGFSVCCATRAVFMQTAGPMKRPGVYGYLYMRNSLEFARRLNGRRAVLACAARNLRTLPVRRMLRPSVSPVERAAFRRWALAGLLGLLAFATGRTGPPPAWLPGRGDVRLERRSGLLARLGLGVLALLVSSVAGCGGGAQSPDEGNGTPLLGLRSVYATQCRAQPLEERSGARAAQRDRGLLLGLDVGLRFEGAPLGRCATANVAQRAGASLVREDFDWGTIEPRPGRFDWRTTDVVVETAAARGLTVLPIVAGRPGWARAGDGEAFGRFVGMAARRYGPGGGFFTRGRGPRGPSIEWWELLNEPYEQANPDYVPADRYARLVRDAVPVARSLAPGARFLLSGEAQYETPGGEEREDWMTELFAAVPGLGSAFDGVAVHSYGESPAPYDANGGRAQSSRLERIHAGLAGRGLGERPIWVTEVGWSTCTRSDECVAPSEQALRIAAFLRLARTRWSAYVRAVVVYQLREAPIGRRPQDYTRYYGLLDGSYRPKPALAAFTDAATR